MAIEKMSLVNIAGLMDELDATLKGAVKAAVFISSLLAILLTAQ